MSGVVATHRKVRTALEKSIQAHQNAHRHHLRQAGLEQMTEQTVSPLGPAGDMGLTTGSEDE
jgi:hypothetical protein